MDVAVRAPRWPYLAKGARQAAYGTATVAMPVWLLRQGFSPPLVGVLVALALFSGAAQSWLSGRLSSSFSVRTITVAASIAMGIGAFLILTHSVALLAVAAVLGGMNIGGQEVGPFTAIEQFALHSASADTRRFAWYNAVGTLGIAAGTMIGGIAPIATAITVYAAAAAMLGVLYAAVLPCARYDGPKLPSPRRSFGIAERFAALFAVDAFGGGFVAQGFLVYWLTWQYHPNIHALSAVLAASNVLARE